MHEKRAANENMSEQRGRLTKGAQTAEEGAARSASVAPPGLAACTTNGPVTPPATGQHRPRKRGRRQAGRRRHWERGVARGLAEAPRRRALSLSLCVAGVGGARGTDARRHGGSMLQKLTKLDPMASCHPFIHLLVTIKPTIVFLGKCQQNRRGAGSPPSSWDLDGGWGGHGATKL